MALLPVLGKIAATAIGAKAASNQVDKANAYNDPAAVRARYEAAGVNPLLAFQGGATPSAISHTLGDTVASGLSGVVDLYGEQEQHKLELEHLRQQNQKLEKYAREQVLRPHVVSSYTSRVDPISPDGGFYESSQKSDSGLHSVSASDRRGPSGTGESVAPNRPTKVAPYESTAGVFEINNRATFGNVVMPGADGDPWGISELLTATFVGVPQVGFNVARGFAEHRAQKKYDKWFTREAQRQNGTLPPPVKRGDRRSQRY